MAQVFWTRSRTPRGGLILSAHEGLACILRREWQHILRLPPSPPPQRRVHPLSFLRDSAGTLLFTAASVLLQFGSGVILARVLLAEGRGLYGLLVLIPYSFQIVMNLGFGAAAMRQVAKIPTSSGKICANALAVAVVSGGLTSLFLVMIHPFWVNFLGERVTTVEGGSLALSLSLLAVPLIMFDQFAGSVLTGMHAVMATNLARFLQAFSFVALLPAAFTLVGKTVPAAMYAWVISFTLSDAAALIMVLQVKKGPFRPDWTLFKQALRFGLKVMPGGAAMYLLFRADLFLVKAFRPLDEVGVYVQATGLAFMYQLFGDSVERAFLPRVFRKSQEDASELTPLVCRCYVLLMLPITAAAFVFAWPMIPLIFGEEFRGSTLPFLILIPGVLIGTPGYLCNTDLQSRGWPGYASVTASGCLLVNILLNLVMIPAWGILGAAVSSLFVYASYGVVLAWVYKRKTGTPLHRVFFPGPQDVRMVKALFKK
ncbi:MAG: flippase [Planctomycetota bacterium]|nr:MAG: flippase [Planctomycetota bacterium]